MDIDQPANKLVFEGRVVQRAECRPPASNNYMDMKKYCTVDNRVLVQP